MSWTWGPARPPVAHDVGLMNGWSARFVREVLDALGASARARSALLEGPPGAALGSPAMALPTAAQLAGALSVQPQLVQTVDIELDLHVWYRSIAGTQPTLAWLERAISPFTVHIGFKSDLDLPAFLAQAGLKPVSIEKVNIPRIWSLVTCHKA